LAIRVPKSVAAKVGLKAHDNLEIEVQDGNVVLKPNLRRVYRRLVKQINPKNVHDEIDTGIQVAQMWAR
jgi:antitoxin MazE